MTEETSIEDKTAAVVAERRKRGPNKAKPERSKEPEHETAAVVAEPDTANTPADTFIPDLPKSKRRLFPVKLLRNYHPVHDFVINGKEPNEEQRVKVFAGTEIDMNIEEARDVIAKGIAERNDPIG